MATFQLAEVSTTGTTPTFQLVEVGVVADAPPATGTVFRLTEVSLASGGGGPTLAAGAVTPGALVLAGTTVGMAVSVGGAFDTVSWVVADTSLPVQLAGSDTEKLFVAPYDPRGGDVLLTVTAHGPGGDSAPLTMHVSVVAHPEWHLSGGVWVPTRSSADVAG